MGALALLAPVLGAPAPAQVVLNGSPDTISEQDAELSGAATSPSPKPRPLVIWHGMGDTAHSRGMDQFANSVRKMYPGIFVHSVIAPNEGSPSDESKAGWVSETVALAGGDGPWLKLACAEVHPSYMAVRPRRYALQMLAA